MIKSKFSISFVLLVFVILVIIGTQKLFAASATITLYNPKTTSEIFVNKQITFFGAVSSTSIKTIEIIIDGSPIGRTSPDKNKLFTLPYTFKAAKKGRFTMIKGYDDKKELIAITSLNIDVSSGNGTIPQDEQNSLSIERFESGNNILVLDEDTTITGKVSGPIEKIEIELDGLILDSISVKDKLFTFTHIFGEILVNQDLVFKGYSASDKLLVTKKYKFSVREAYIFDDRYFNKYVVKAVKYLNEKYGLLGYNLDSALTHDMPFFDKDGNIVDTITKMQKNGASSQQTMCVAAQLEVILTAFEIYAKETGDFITPYLYNPSRSYKKLGKDNFRGHLWVEPKYNTNGSADALYNFGMGEVVPFSKLTPGSFVNINRTTRSGHATTFLNFVDINGNEIKVYDSAKVKGFRYFSAQGSGQIGVGGFFEKIAFFMSSDECSKKLPASVPTRIRDCNVIYSTSQVYLNTGLMLSPKYWNASARKERLARIPASVKSFSVEGKTNNFIDINPSLATVEGVKEWKRKFDNGYEEEDNE